jgi:hypothetical protein
MLMLRKSIPIFKIGVIITAAGVALYFYNDNYGKYVLGAGLMIISVAMVFYILFMFKRYGERKKN